MGARVVSREEAEALLSASFTTLRLWLAEVPVERYDDASAVTGWSLRDLLTHLGRGLDVLAVAEIAPPGAQALTVGAYIHGYPEHAEAIAEATRDASAALGGGVLDEVDAAFARATDTLNRWSGDEGVVVVHGKALALADLILTRVLEFVVHGDDIARSLRQPPPAFDRAVMRTTVRVLLDALSQVHPGQAVEVRVPPFAAVQCIPGPRHTRGTPPNTIQTDPWTWIRLAAGRLSWPEAVTSHLVAASGERATLETRLPLL